MPNETLARAREAQNDEFYTHFHDIEKEINAYLEYNCDVFRGKTVLLPCDDPEWSNFTKFFVLNFVHLGLKKLISTCYASEDTSKAHPITFESNAPQFNAEKSTTHGKILVLERKAISSKRILFENLPWKYLEGNGDFCSQEICKLRDEADFIITNPPFSLFRRFLAWILEGKKQFLTLGNMNAVSYKEVFPLIKDNIIWLGVESGAKEYMTPTGENQKMGNTCWFTNIEHGRRHQPLPLMTMADNLKFSSHKEIKGKDSYYHYDNYDAIEVPYTDAIPSDYDGAMGVPISFVDKYCPEQFDILGITKTWFGMANKTYPEQIQVDKNGKESRVTKLNDGATIRHDTIPIGETYYIVDNNYYTQVYARIIIRKKQ